MLLGLGALMSLAMIPASAVTNLTGEYTFTTNTDPYGILVLNNNTANGSYGIQANSYAPQGAGVYGYSDASGLPGYGLAGISQNGYGVYGSSYGSGITAIYGEDLNAGGGIGIAGVSNGGNGAYGEGAQNGVVGQTNNANSGANYSGVYGIDNSAAGVTGYGVYGTTANNIGVLGVATGSTGTPSGVVGSGVYGVSGYGDVGGYFGGYSGNSTGPALLSYDAVGGTDLLATYTYLNSSGTITYPESFIVQTASLNNSGDVTSTGASDVQISGDLYVGGAVFADCPDFPESDPFGNTSSADACDNEFDVRKSSTGAKLKTYNVHQSMSSMEDFGEGQLVDGHAYVPLEATYASSIARDHSYLVFITPEGDSNGLYVTGRSLTGFMVRESRSGRDTIGFTYRIVARPYGDRGLRMAALPAKRSLVSGPRLAVNSRVASMLKNHRLRASIGSRITRPPHVWVKNMHRTN